MADPIDNNNETLSVEGEPGKKPEIPLGTTTQQSSQIATDTQAAVTGDLFPFGEPTDYETGQSAWFFMQEWSDAEIEDFILDRLCGGWENPKLAKGRAEESPDNMISWVLRCAPPETQRRIINIMRKILERCENLQLSEGVTENEPHPLNWLSFVITECKIVEFLPDVLRLLEKDSLTNEVRDRLLFILIGIQQQNELKDYWIEAFDGKRFFETDNGKVAVCTGLSVSHPQTALRRLPEIISVYEGTENPICTSVGSLLIRLILTLGEDAVKARFHSADITDAQREYCKACVEEGWPSEEGVQDGGLHKLF